MIAYEQTSSKGPGYTATDAAFEILASIGGIFERTKALRTPAAPERRTPVAPAKAETPDAEAARILAYIAHNLEYDETIKRYRWKTGNPYRRAGDIAGSVDRGIIVIDGKKYSTVRLRYIECTGYYPKSSKLRSIIRAGEPQLKLRKDSSTGIQNVCSVARTGKFGVAVAGHHYGFFDNIDEAACTAGNARRKAYGDKLAPKPKLDKQGLSRHPLPDAITVRAQVAYALEWVASVQRYRWKIERPRIRAGKIAGCKRGLISLFGRVYSTRPLRFLQLYGRWPSRSELCKWETQ